MNKQDHLAAWDVQRMRHGITLRVIDQLNDELLNSHPIQGMRTPIELVVHMYASAEQMLDAVLNGSVGLSSETTKANAIKTKAQLLEFVNKTWVSLDKKAHQITESQLKRLVGTDWGKPFPGYAMLGLIYDEYVHHRGQLYAFVRVFGIEPVMLWDFERNTTEFAPQVTAKF